ncbi:uncharacterized protein LY89DRAFT_472281 [Mollisia scopiformis]|uniref:Uncharacterized protein n=1 Tax=Mollisia scopiformis TaxID=149040 RepID=A0A194XJ36_MOLSC|nr:uncharacterized protein LY89DRAFT_472281 [Mollisia scopiformis]KUJ20136.1 hypothetical protein LY89DRAFT_472281 [Mollisia scopiformis]
MAGVRGGWLELGMTSLTLRRGNGPGKRLLMKQSIMEYKELRDEVYQFTSTNHDSHATLSLEQVDDRQISEPATVRATNSIVVSSFCASPNRSAVRSSQSHQQHQKPKASVGIKSIMASHPFCWIRPHSRILASQCHAMPCIRFASAFALRRSHRYVSAIMGPYLMLDQHTPQQKSIGSLIYANTASLFHPPKADINA